MKKFLVTSHDAGGAEIISSWIKHHLIHEYHYILAGPALPIFCKKLTQIENHSINELEQYIQSVDIILTGTSWNSDLEVNAIQIAKHFNKKVVTFLEHWINYKERFKKNNSFYFPDEIWVGDEEGLRIAEKEFPNIKIVLQKNYYFSDMTNEILSLTSKILSNTIKILYICEPIAKAALWKYGNENFFGFTEKEALEYFFNCLSHSTKKSFIEKIIIRPHPSENHEKYHFYLEQNKDFNVEMSQSSLIEDCAWANCIVGCASNALVLGLLANKHVFSSIPIKNSNHRLPHKKIKPFNIEALDTLLV